MDAQTQFDLTMAAVGSKTTYAGAISTIASWLLSSQFGIIFGLFLAFAGFAINWYYKYKQDKREIELHKERLRTLNMIDEKITNNELDESTRLTNFDKTL